MVGVDSRVPAEAKHCAGTDAGSEVGGLVGSRYRVAGDRRYGLGIVADCRMTSMGTTWSLRADRFASVRRLAKREYCGRTRLRCTGNRDKRSVVVRTADCCGID